MEKEDVAFRLVHLIFADTVLFTDRTEACQLLGDCLPLAICQREQVVSTAHQVDEGPIEERFVIVVGTAAAPFVLPDKLSILPREVVEEGLDRLIHRIE